MSLIFDILAIALAVTSAVTGNSDQMTQALACLILSKLYEDRS